MTYRRGSFVSGHFRNGSWVSPHFRSGTTVLTGIGYASNVALPSTLNWQRLYAAPNSDAVWGSLSSDTACSNAHCPKCGKSVYFIRHNGGCVWLDGLGWPWPKHACYLEEASVPWFAQLQGNIAAPCSAATNQASIGLGIITGIQLGNAKNNRSHVSVDCGKGLYVFVAISCNAYDEQAPKPGTIAALNFNEFVLATSAGNRLKIESLALTTVRWDLRQDWNRFSLKWLTELDEEGETAVEKHFSSDFRPEARDYNGRTLLMLAAIRGNLEEARSLLTQGSNPNLLDNLNQSALYYAVINQHPAVVELLRANGADTSQQTAAEALLDRVGHLDTPAERIRSSWHRGVDEFSFADIETALKSGLDLAVTDSNGRTPLIRAAIRGDVPAVRFLIENGSPINHLDRFGQSAIYYATVNKRSEVGELLALNGADLSQQDAAKELLSKFRI